TPNLKEQVRLLEELAQHETYAEAPWETCVCERRSASDCLWDKRPDFMRLWHCLEPGDFLLVWRLDRIERTLHAGNRFLAAAHDK
ncbi:MAG: recombinase family protein, partial [Anaerolineae bacterium]|nr:recombinase family protein [Anaerolineae bacterium]